MGHVNIEILKVNGHVDGSTPKSFTRLAPSSNPFQLRNLELLNFLVEDRDDLFCFFLRGSIFKPWVDGATPFQGSLVVPSQCKLNWLTVQVGEMLRLVFD